MSVFVYVVVTDSGFAPNPFFGYCTLATCKPRVRRSADVGDWVAGVGSVQRGREGRLVYAMRVSETMCFDEYWNDPRFACKRPDAERPSGDNIYHRDPATDVWIQEPGFHSNRDGGPYCAKLARDTNPPRVLIGREFAYFGADAVEIPGWFGPLGGVDYFSKIRDYRRRLPEGLRDGFVAWIEELAAVAGGRAGTPADPPDRPSGYG